VTGHSRAEYEVESDEGSRRETVTRERRGERAIGLKGARCWDETIQSATGGVQASMMRPTASSSVAWREHHGGRRASRVPKTVRVAMKAFSCSTALAVRPAPNGFGGSWLIFFLSPFSWSNSLCGSALASSVRHSRD